jgi:hypothetical protein
MLLLIILVTGAALADPLQDAAVYADVILSDSAESLETGISCQAPAEETPKAILKKSLQQALPFSGVFSVDSCDEITIYRTGPHDRAAIGYYGRGESARPFEVACDRLQSDADCRQRLRQRFRLLQTSGPILGSNQPANPFGVPTVAIDNTYVHQPVLPVPPQVPADAYLQGYTCGDGTLSAEQGNSWGVGGWEGRCGQTAATNVLYSLCGKISPSLRKRGVCSREDGVFNDVLPGVLPSTMAADYNEFLSLNACTERTVSSRRVENAKLKDFYDNRSSLSQVIEEQMKMVTSALLKSTHPTMFMIETTDGPGLHWVTVTGSEDRGGKKFLKINHWGGQYFYSLEDFAKLTLKASKSETGVGFVFAGLNYVSIK